MAVITARKRPLCVAACQFDGRNHREIRDFCPDVVIRQYNLQIPTLEGSMVAEIGDYIIRGVSGEFYPCKPDIFSASYDIVGGL